jgi:hypothetical protein
VNAEIVETLFAMPDVGGPVHQALARLLQDDQYLFEIDVNERTLTHRLAMYLQPSFPEWHVDCEYNRDEHRPKELWLPGGDPDAFDTNAQTVYPDIIVHKRGTNENRLVIEVKKTSSQVNAEKDFLKLQEYRSQLEYEHALFVELSVRPHAPGVSRVQWVVD